MCKSTLPSSKDKQLCWQSPKNSDLVLEYLEGIHSHLRMKVMFFTPKIVNKAFAQTRYPENTDSKKRNSSKKDIKDNSKDINKKRKWKDKTIKTIAHH